MTNSPTTEFHEVDVIRLLPHHERLNLLKEAISKKLSKGEYLVHQGAVWPYAAYIVSGQLRWTMLSTIGKEHVLLNFKSGKLFWAHSMFDGEPMPASLVATEKTKVLIWDKETILRYLRNYPDAMWEVTKILTQTMRHAREIIYNLAFKPVAGRLASVLFQQCADISATSIERNFTLNDLAAMVAATPEVVCRLLYQFQEEGVLEITRASITIQDIDALKQAGEE